MFPEKSYDDAHHFATDYLSELARAARAIDTEAFDAAANLVVETIRTDHTIYVCGNGGSAAISNHLLCDFTKGIQTDTMHRPKIVSLSSHVELITAIGNDLSFADVFVYQLRTAARPGDLLLTISSSGNSENIVRPLQWSSNNAVRSIAMTGFDGGRARALADVNLHVPAHNYGIIEDLHQSVMHILAQFVRMRSMEPGTTPTHRF